MSKRERVYKALQLKTPDRVPGAELVIDDELISEMTGKENIDYQDHIVFREWLGIDAVCVAPVRQEESLKDMAPGAGTSREDGLDEAVDRYLEGEYDCTPLENYRRESDLFVFALLNGSLGELSRAIGFENLMVSLARDPEGVKRQLHKLGEKNIGVAKEAAARGAEAVIIGDDIAYRQGPFISPEIMRRVIFPAWEGETKAMKNMGLPVVLHTEGYLNPLLPDLVGLFDGLHSLEPASGMSLTEVKEKYGDRLCLMGNVDLTILNSGEAEAEEAEEAEELEKLRRVVKETIQAGAPGGGYIFGTTGGLHAGLSLKKVQAMYRFAREYGKGW